MRPEPSPADPPQASSATGADALGALWRSAGLPDAALAHVRLTGADPVLPSSFAIAAAAQSAAAACTLAAAEIWHRRSGAPRQQVHVDAAHALLECRGWFTVDGVASELWDPLSGLYACGADAGEPGWVRVHANFAHHRDRALAVLGLPPGAGTSREAVTHALRRWRAEPFEDAVMAAGGVAAAVRSHAQWQAHPQAQALQPLPVVRIERIGDAAARPWQPLEPPSDGTVDGPADGATRAASAPADGGPARAMVPPAQQPLAGLRVLDLTRILAGPVAARTLAGHGADVLMVNGPRLPNIGAIADMSRGKRSALLELESASGRQRLHELIGQADVFLQGYRPGALAAHGFAPQHLAEAAPGLVVASLSAYGGIGPWGGRRGFDSLVQTVSGFNVDEAAAAGRATPAAMPVQILDYCAGYLLAFGIGAALLRQRDEGGSWHVQVSLASVAQWLRGLGRVDGGLAVTAPDVPAAWIEDEPSGWGRLRHLSHAATLSLTPPCLRLPSMPPGTHEARWAD